MSASGWKSQNPILNLSSPPPPPPHYVAFKKVRFLPVYVWNQITRKSCEGSGWLSTLRSSGGSKSFLCSPEMTAPCPSSGVLRLSLGSACTTLYPNWSSLSNDLMRPNDSVLIRAVGCKQQKPIPANLNRKAMFVWPTHTSPGEWKSQVWRVETKINAPGLLVVHWLRLCAFPMQGTHV